MREPLLKVQHITKKFPGITALNDVSIEFEQGEIHAICGENGAGKSTLIKILTGAYTPTSGSIQWEGASYESFTPRQAMDLGITAIYQEFNLVPFLSVAENVFFGRELKKGLFLDKREMRRRTAQLASEMEIQVNPRAKLKDLGVAYAQITEILKAISHETKLLIMDEPSAPLSNREIEAMFKVVRKLRSKGVTIVYISHRMDEIFELCDRVTVMRDGRHISTKPVKETDRRQLIADMVGRELGEDFVGGAGPGEEIVLEARGLTTEKIQDVSFQLRKGEILGLGGLVGAGRTETARAIFGADRLRAGSLLVKGREVRFRQPRDAIAGGVALLTEDRKNQGLILGMSVLENGAFSIMKELSRGLFVDQRRQRELMEEKRKELSIKTPGLEQKVKFLSGGNQQKVVLAKWLLTRCDIFIFDEPTRGIDVGAKQEIYHLMRRLTQEGKSIIMISSEMPELLGMSDRVLVMHEGRICGELSKEAFSQEEVLRIASGM